VFGAANYGMCGRAFEPDLLFAYPNSRIGVMGAAQAANTLLAVKQAALEN
jgi:3-methylcrotonyl-CoA carboxylase beta subunit